MAARTSSTSAAPTAGTAGASSRTTASRASFVITCQDSFAATPLLLAPVVTFGDPGGVNIEADVIVVGAGLAGLVATAELADAGRRVILVDQEPEASLGGQAWWSFGGLFLVDSPEQRRLRGHDSLEPGWQGWVGPPRLRPPEDYWAPPWA